MDEIESFLNAHPDIEYIDGMLPDLSGIIRGKRINREDLRKIYDKGFFVPASTVLLYVIGDSDDPEGIGFSDGDPDATVMPIPGTLVPVPWFEKPIGQVLCGLYDDDGTPHYLDPRGVLGKVVERFHAIGLNPVVALEQEFYLIDPEPGADGFPQPPILPATGRRASGTQVLSIVDLEDFGLFLDQVSQACKIQNIPTGAVSAEYAVGQFEINLLHTDDPLAAADHAVLLPRVIKSVARQHGIEATFMAKPFAEQAGSGMHMHVSLLDEKGNNIFSGGDESGNRTLHHAVGGLLETMPDAMAIFAPNINSYRRYAPDIYVPIRRNWGVNNRSVAVRVPGGDDENRRIEHRMAGADANPYLALAAVLAGMHHGMVNKIQPPEMSVGNDAHELDPEIPFRWGRALDKMAQSEWMAEYLGEKYLRAYVACKRGEMDSFLSRPSRREYAWYLRPDY